MALFVLPINSAIYDKLSWLHYYAQSFASAALATNFSLSQLFFVQRTLGEFIHAAHWHQTESFESLFSVERIDGTRTDDRRTLRNVSLAPINCHYLVWAQILIKPQVDM